MKPLNTTGIILNRTNFGEADRILSFLTPDYGKLRLMAKGVRQVKSKLAGGIELFSISQISYIPGKRGIGMLTSTRLIKHYGQIVKNLESTMLAYELIKQLDRATEDEPESAYFELLQQVFGVLDNSVVDPALMRAWFDMQLIRLAGHRPNLTTDVDGQDLKATALYSFSLDDMAFVVATKGRFNADHIKFLRLGFGRHPVSVLERVSGLNNLLPDVAPLLRAMFQAHIRI